MTDDLIAALTLVSALGSGLIAGMFFAFSAFVMRALGRIAAPAAIAAMQSINATVLNPVFFLVFFGTAATSAVLAAVSLSAWQGPRAPWLLAGGLLYLLGCLVVTIACNVPLNTALARVAPDSAQAARPWTTYLSRWTAWNHVRTAASLAAAAAFIQALR